MPPNPQVQTVRGPVAASDLGTVLMHEHARSQRGAPAEPPGELGRAGARRRRREHDGVGSGVVILSVWVVFCVGAMFSLDRTAASTGIVHAAHRGRPSGAGA